VITLFGKQHVQAYSTTPLVLRLFLTCRLKVMMWSWPMLIPTNLYMGYITPVVMVFYYNNSTMIVSLLENSTIYEAHCSSKSENL